MRSVLLTVMALTFISLPAMAQETDDSISAVYTKVRPDTAAFRVERVAIRLDDKIVVLVGHEVDADGNWLEPKRIKLPKIEDDPETPENEADNQYWKFLKKIQDNLLPQGVEAANGIQKSIKMAVEATVAEQGE